MLVFIQTSTSKRKKAEFRVKIISEKEI